MILEQISSIGDFISRNYPEEDPLDAMLNKIEGDKLKSIIEINVASDKVTYEVKDFRKDVVKDALFYQKGNGALGQCHKAIVPVIGIRVLNEANT